MTHHLAPHFARSTDIQAEIGGRPPDLVDHVGEMRERIERHHPDHLRLVVKAVVDETPSTRTYRLARADGGPLPPFQAGQYLSVAFDGTTRAYAISSSPAVPDFYDLTIRRVPRGRISNLVLDTVRVGTSLLTSGPTGTFVHNPLFHGDSVVFLAGGSGVVPAMSMIRDIVDNRIERDFHLVYASRDDGDVIFKTELQHLAASERRITVDHVISGPSPRWTGRTGHLDDATIASIVGDLRGRMVYVCGPQGLYPFAATALASLGHPRRRIRFEANGAPMDIRSDPGWPLDSAPSQPTAIRVEGTQIDTVSGRPLLDALEDGGIGVPALCRSGECGACRVRVVSGSVFNAREAQLRMSDEAAGYVHSCVAYPLGDVELDVGGGSRSGPFGKI